MRPLVSTLCWASGVRVEIFMHGQAQGLPDGTPGHFGPLAHNWLSSLSSLPGALTSAKNQKQVHGTKLWLSSEAMELGCDYY